METPKSVPPYSDGFTDERDELAALAEEDAEESAMLKQSAQTEKGGSDAK